MKSANYRSPKWFFIESMSDCSFSNNTLVLFLNVQAKKVLQVEHLRYFLEYFAPKGWSSTISKVVLLQLGFVHLVLLKFVTVFSF